VEWIGQGRRWREYAALMVVTVLGVPFAQAASYTAQEQANLKVVADFYAALDEGEANGDLSRTIRTIAEKYLAPNYIQHSEVAQGLEGGREGLIKMFASRPVPPVPAGPSLPPNKVLAMFAQGDLVVRISARSVPSSTPGSGSTSYIFNLFRIANGRLAEHWDGSSGSMRAPVPSGTAPAASPEGK
jgi:predicted SnoaL-like aldol condensation-catalyzing enzyme